MKQTALKTTCLSVMKSTAIPQSLRNCRGLRSPFLKTDRVREPGPDLCAGENQYVVAREPFVIAVGRMVEFCVSIKIVSVVHYENTTIHIY